MFLSAEDAARALQCTPDTARRLAAAGTIPGRKLGRRWLFDPDQLDKLREAAGRVAGHRDNIAFFAPELVGVIGAIDALRALLSPAPSIPPDSTPATP